MADEDKNGGSGAWSRVPTWDGDPKGWRAFLKEMHWWMSALDLEGTKRYNLAARWLLRQGGIVRQRGEEFSPEELEYQKAVTALDPQTEEEVVITPEDPLAGLKKLLKALESINGKTLLDKRGDLRNAFYLELRRKPGERISEFCTRFRSAVADLDGRGDASIIRARMVPEAEAWLGRHSAAALGDRRKSRSSGCSEIFMLPIHWQGAPTQKGSTRIPS